SLLKHRPYCRVVGHDRFHFICYHNMLSFKVSYLSSYISASLTDSNSSTISLDGLDTRLNIIIARDENIKPGIISYISNTPPERLYQSRSVTPPTIIPAIAPERVILFQKRANRISGPKVAPMPPHAQETRLNMELLGSSPRNIAITDTII